MKNGLICVALLLCICAGMSAQYLYNPANTPAVGNGNSWPFNLFTKWRFQFIIDKSKLGGAPVNITDIAFSGYYSGTRTFTSADFEMSMGHTTYKDFGTSGTTKFATILGASPTVVYPRGAISWACNYHAWSDIGLKAPFAYNGTDNICVEIRYNNTASGGAVTITDPGIARAYTHANYDPDPFNAVNWYTPIPGEYMGPIHRLTTKAGGFTCNAPAKLSITAPAKPGSIDLSGGPATDYFQIAASLGNATKIDLGKCAVYLDFDGVLLYSILVGVPYFNGYAGTLVGGMASAKFAPPDMSALIGVDVYHAAAAYDKGGITDCSNTVKTTLTK